MYTTEILDARVAATKEWISKAGHVLNEQRHRSYADKA